MLNYEYMCNSENKLKEEVDKYEIPKNIMEVTDSGQS